MHCDSIDTLRRHLVLLVLHQCNERTHHNCQAWGCESSELINERFSTAGWHDDECVSALEQRLDRLPLSFTEIIMAEAFTQQGANACLIHLVGHGVKTIAESVP